MKLKTKENTFKILGIRHLRKYSRSVARACSNRQWPAFPWEHQSSSLASSCSKKTISTEENRQILNSFQSLKFGLVVVFLAFIGMLPGSFIIAGDGGVTFTNVGSDLEYRRVKAPNWQRISGLRKSHLIGGEGLFVGDLPGVPSPKEHPFIGLLPELMPGRFHGINGVSVFDYDNDGDLDMYVTNGPAPTDPDLSAVSPSSANALLINQYCETGKVAFVDKAMEAGVDVPDHDGYGTCYGDMDNDGDEDLIVTGNGVENLFFVNNGDGTFTKAKNHGMEGKGNFAVFARPSNLNDINDPDPEGRYFPPNGPELLVSKKDNHVYLNSTGCGTGDFNGDGYLDVAFINSWDQGRDFAPCFRPWLLDEVQHNQLFLNNGNNTFTDVSETSGVQVLNGIVDAAGNPITGVAGITWGLGIADVDQDGDLDMLFADDQCEIFPVEHGGPLDRGFIHVMLNDGNANFIDVPIKDRAESSSTWMSIAFGDYNGDGHMDFFASSFGDNAFNHIGVPNDPGDHSSRWFLGKGDGTFKDINLFDDSMTDVTGLLSDGATGHSTMTTTETRT